MVYWPGLMMFLVAQMAEVLVEEIFQYNGINSQLPWCEGSSHWGEDIMPPMRHVYRCVSVVFVTIHRALPLLSKCFQTILS